MVERVGKYSGTLEAGFHVLVPFLDKVRYTHSLKELSLVVPPQPCFTEDNVRVEVGGSAVPHGHRSAQGQLRHQ